MAQGDSEDMETAVKARRHQSLDLTQARKLEK
jgi:hypothetical protein